MTHIDRNEAIARIKKALKARSGKSWSVTGGRGTAWGWIDINVPPARRRDGGMTEEARLELQELLGLPAWRAVHFQSESVSPEQREWYVLRAEGARGRDVPGGADWDPSTVPETPTETQGADSDPAPSCGCEADQPEADPEVFACPCGDHCSDPACAEGAALRRCADGLRAEEAAKQRLAAAVANDTRPARLTEDGVRVAADSGTTFLVPTDEERAARRALYEVKVANRLERLRARAERRRAEGTALIEPSHAKAQIIPLGQPILVGHHSEGRDRRFRARIDAGLRKGFEAMKEASALDRRLAAAERNEAISSDDPDAVDKLRAKVAEFEATARRWKEVNVTIRIEDKTAAKDGLDPRVAAVRLIGALRYMGASEEELRDWTKPDFAGRIGIARYRFTNLSSEVRRLKARIAQLEERERLGPAHPECIGDVRIVEEDNRLRMVFPAKPDEATRAALKGSGFRWSPSAGAWQRFPTGAAWNEARRIATRFAEKERSDAQQG